MDKNIERYTVEKQENMLMCLETRGRITRKNEGADLP